MSETYPYAPDYDYLGDEERARIASGMPRPPAEEPRSRPETPEGSTARGTGVGGPQARSEAAGAVDWRAIAERREGELKEALTELHRLQVIERNASEYLCPNCNRWAPWTDGELAADCGEDWFWCQTCSAETPLSAMASRIADSRPVHYREAAASLRSMAAVSRAEVDQNTTISHEFLDGIDYAATRLERTAQDLEGDTDGE